MKRLLFTIFAGLAAASALQAQETYLNDRMTNTSDVIGTARYVGMGGAMGALGADISVISNNPAGIALMSKNNLSLTMGTQIQDAAPGYGDSRAVFTFDQAGLVAAFNDDDGSRLTLAFNYQKKANYNQSIFAQQALNGLSQMDMFAWIANSTATPKDGNFTFASPLYDNLYASQFFKAKYPIGTAGNYFYTPERGDRANFYRHSWGGLHAFDINISGSYQNRVFFGLTAGIDYLRYRQDLSYEEIGTQSYVLYQDQDVDGSGFNIKLGTIVRPIEDSPLRFGITVETPTWMTLKHKAHSGVSVIQANGDYTTPSYIDDNNYLEYNVFTPWKFRASLGSTVDDYLAWDVEYEYCMNDYTKMGYPRESYDNYYGNGGTSVDMDKDVAMSELTHRMTRGVHNLRAGIEYRPMSALAVRAGYNFYSSHFVDNARLDQTVNSGVMDFTTSTEYINLGAKHILTLGLGYQGKVFYADIAYKYGHQRGDFYSFDDYFTSDNKSFATENPTLKDVQLKPTKLNLDRHNVAVTLGCRF